jgi:uncharacterized membrane protein
LNARTDKRLHEVFELSLVLKTLFALSELISGIGVYLIPPGWLMDAARWMSGHELIEDPNDVIARHLLDFAAGFSIGTQQFWAIYLVGHAVVKLAVVAGLMLRIQWAYPASIWVLFGFIAYQIERFVHTQSPMMVFLTLFDLVVIWLIWHEYKGMKAAAAR